MSKRSPHRVVLRLRTVVLSSKVQDDSPIIDCSNPLEEWEIWERMNFFKVAPFGARVVVVVVGWGGAKQEKTIPTQQLSRKPENHNFSFYVTSSSARKRPFLKEVILVLSSEQCSGGGGEWKFGNWIVTVALQEMIENDMKNLEWGLPLKTWWITNGDRLTFRDGLTQCRCSTSWHIKAAGVCFASGFDILFLIFISSGFPAELSELQTFIMMNWNKVL